MEKGRYLLHLFCIFIIVFIAVCTPAASAATGEVTGNVVNLRTGPGTDYQVSGQLVKGAEVTILASQNGWYQVKLSNGQQGWMSSQYIKTNGGKTITDLRNAFIKQTSPINQVHKDLVSRSATSPPSRGGVDRPDTVNPDTNRKLIVIDPGHGGNDPGAMYYGANEKDLNLAMGLKLGQTLEQAGYQVIYTRSEDKAVPLADRSRIANEANVPLFVSIHCNASTDKNLSGTITYYTASNNTSLNNERLKLATAVQSSLVSSLGTADKGVRTANFLVTRETVMPSILVETAFMSNSHDISLLKDEDKQWIIARAIAQGIINYMDQ